MSGQDHSQGENSREEKPLKKARYVWEVKGKYHLREPVENDNHLEPSTSSVQLPRGIDFQTSIADSADSHFQNYLVDAKELMRESVRDAPSNWTIDEDIDINPASLRCMREHDEDYYMQHWHANQLARGFMDNTINTVLEKWLTTPLEACSMEDSRYNHSNDGRIEDDAILMAIQSHGLRGAQEYLPAENFAQENLMNSRSNSIRSLDDPICLELDHERDSNDFLHAAVSAAIQEKGLSYGCS